MKYSVLLPTRSGGRFLEYCLASILNQEYEDFELVVSDNANTDETPEIISMYANDRRLRSIRHERVLNVVDNWTEAYKASRGDFILMIGDDDYLLPGYFRRMDEILRRYDDPSCVIYNGFSFVHPGSIAGENRSFWSRYHFYYGPEFQEETIMEYPLRYSIVKDMFRFRQRIPLNMQTTLFRRDAAMQIEGEIFSPPFPDHYILNALLLTAEKWIYHPGRLVVVGVTPKSFGHYHYSQEGKAGLSYLGVNTNFPDALPGSELINGMCVWLMHLKTNYVDKLEGIEIDRPSYVRRQVYSWMRDLRYGAIGIPILLNRLSMMRLDDWRSCMTAVCDFENWQRFIQLLGSFWNNKASSLWRGLEPLDGIDTIHEFSQWLQDYGLRRIE